jgi:hypothetical protein
MAKNRGASVLISWRMKLRILQAVFLAFGTAVALFVQLFMFPLAGKRVSDNSASYAYQLDIWTNEIFSRFETISRTAPYDEIDLTKERQLTPEYINKVASFHTQILQVLRVLSYQAGVVARLASEVGTLTESGGSLDKKSRQELVNGLQLFVMEAKRQAKMRSEIEQFNKQLREAYSPDAPPVENVDASVDRMIQQTNAIQVLFRKPELLLRPNENPLEFLQNFGKTQDVIFKSYSKLVAQHNQQVEAQEFYRDALQVVIALITACLLLDAELKANRMSSISGKKQSKSRRSST